MTDRARAAPTSSHDPDLRRLADVDAGDVPVLSIYLDLRPQASGERPAERPALTVMRDRLDDIEGTYWPRGPDYESFTADRRRIESFLDQSLDPAAAGVAIFACQAIDLWEVVETGEPFHNSVSAGSTPDLFQLARLLDEHETAVVVVADTNTVRLFVSSRGRFAEIGGPNEATDSFRKRSLGGWSEARYQRHIDKHIADFAKTAAEHIERLLDQSGASRLILAGDEVAVTPLEAALGTRARQRLAGVTRIGIRAARDDVAEEVRPILDSLERHEGLATADRVVGLVRAGGLAVSGVAGTRRMLEQGAVDTLVFVDRPWMQPDEQGSPDARSLEEIQAVRDVRPPGSPGVDLAARAELTRLAAQSSARVEVVDGHEALERAGGVGALLRYRPGAPGASPTG